MLHRNRPLKPFKGAEWNGIRWTGTPPQKKSRKKVLRRATSKRHKLNLIYSQRRKWFLSHPENNTCPIAAAGLIRDLYGEFKPHYRSSNTIHHVWHRGKYFLDESTWMGCSLEGHMWINANPDGARSYGWLCDTEETKVAWRDKHNGLPLK